MLQQLTVMQIHTCVKEKGGHFEHKL